MLYVGIDPSYGKTGVTYWNEAEKQITFQYISPQGSNENYKSKVIRALEIWKVVTSRFNKEEINLIIEEPLITSMKSSALGVLSGVLVASFIFNEVESIYTINPSVISAVNKDVKGRTRENRKKISLEVALAILEELKKIGYIVTILNDKVTKDGKMKVRKLSPDEAESLLMTILLIQEKDKLSSEVIHSISRVSKGIFRKYQINKIKENGEQLIYG
jgi:ribosomal protein S8